MVKCSTDISLSEILFVVSRKPSRSARSSMFLQMGEYSQHQVSISLTSGTRVRKWYLEWGTGSNK